MNILCILFGHKTNEHVYGGSEYVRIGSPRQIDGIGRVHATLYARCPRCGQEYRAGRLHIPKERS